MSGIILPRIHRVEFHDFQPLFDQSIVLDLPTGPFLILGGNGMGKTTSLQAIVFGVAGDAGSDIEKETDYQWEADYFGARLANPKEARVIVEISFGTTHLTIKRSMASGDVVALRVGKGQWIEDCDLATAEYERIVVETGNYPSFPEYRYLIHRLCYLAENRRDLLWDKAAQVRVVMLICGDAATEASFRKMRAILQKTDTDKRHLYVDIGRLRTRIARLKERQSTAKKNVQTTPEQASKIAEEAAALQTRLSRISSGRMQALRRLRRSREALRVLNAGLEEQQGRLSAVEDGLILKTLRQVENSSNALALHKLLAFRLCPYCAQRTEKLSNFAKNAVENGKCPICGQIHRAEASFAAVSDLRINIVTNTRKRAALEKSCASYEAALFDLEQEELSFRARLNEITLKLPRVPTEDELELNTSDLASLEATLKAYEHRHLQLDQQCVEIRKTVEEQFEEFASSSARRLQQLQEVASDYGKAFLGDPCEFVAVPAPGELSAFKFFVPKFGDTERRRPEACSESERFFLDIGFRMALFDLAGVLSNTRGTFICETPENALDLAYTENVAEMFAKFALREFSVLLTGNIQIGGVAKPLLAKYAPAERPKRVFNLMHAGEPTQVQERKRGEFERQFQSMVERNGT